MLTKFEEREFVKRTPSLTNRIFEDENDSILLFKVLANYMDKTNVNKLQLSMLNESILDDSEQLKHYISDILEHMAKIASEETEFSPSYTTGQLAKYFGVSITTINNWIKDGRFQGVQRVEKNAQARISGNTTWKSKTGKLHLISEIIKDWEEEQAENGENQYDTNEQVFLIRQMALYEKKYGGNFEHTLGLKAELTIEEETDIAAWKYFRRKFNEFNADRSSKE